MVAVFIRKNCIQMVFVYFAFWGLQEEFSTHALFILLYFIILVVAISF
jgi:hypothetical protein